MGTQAIAIMLGIGPLDGVQFFDRENETVGLVDRYRSHLGSYWHPDVPRYPDNRRLPAVGFFVACGGSGMTDDGVPYLEPCPLDDIPQAYAKSITLAKWRWVRFSDWCATQGVVLPEPRLYLTETGVA